MYQKGIKRLLAVVLSACGLLVLSPLLLLLCLAIKLDSPGPVFFKPVSYTHLTLPTTSRV